MMRSAETTETCTTGTETGKCAPDHCDVQIGDSVYCSQCSGGSSETSSPAPTNGVCTTDNNECSVKADGRCTTCAHESFMFKGGCYRTGQDPGQTMCKTAQDGVCTAAVETKEYFVPPGADASHDSVVSCGDTAGVTFGSDSNTNNYKGVGGCAKCSAPNSISGNTGTAAATCRECATDLYLKTETDGATSCVSKCPVGYFEHTATGGLKTCQSCSNENTGLNPAAAGVTGCAACTYASNKVTCTKCEAGKYLKSDGTCADSCAPNTEFVKNDPTNGNKCAACSTVADGGIENCAECALLTPVSRSSATLITCTKCTGKKLSPLKDACLTACPAGTYDDNNICKPCHVSCAECNNNAEVTSCTACYPGHVLSKTDSGNTGTCIPECTGRYAENCEAGMCTAVLGGGSKYCSRCKSGYVPVDGLCVSAGTRTAPTGCTPGNGVCNSCTGTYFLQSGGCYLSTAYPGKTLCSSAASGKCTKCANGQTADSGTGSCPACPAGCSKCSGSSGSQTCSECLAGYYKSGTSCVKCSENSTNGGNTITGVRDCVSCVPPTGSTGTVTCYVKTSGGGNNTDGGPNLSSGAITGISVAVIVVVGGLVGFLCWWFVCRGKA